MLCNSTHDGDEWYELNPHHTPKGANIRPQPETLVSGHFFFELLHLKFDPFTMGRMFEFNECRSGYGLNDGGEEPRGGVDLGVVDWLGYGFLRNRFICARLKRDKQNERIRNGKTNMASFLQWPVVADINRHRHCYPRRQQRTTTTTAAAALIRPRCARGAVSRAFDRTFGARPLIRSARPCQRPARRGRGEMPKQE